MSWWWWFASYIFHHLFRLHGVALYWWACTNHSSLVSWQYLFWIDKCRRLTSGHSCLLIQQIECYSVLSFVHKVRVLNCNFWCLSDTFSDRHFILCPADWEAVRCSWDGSKWHHDAFLKRLTSAPYLPGWQKLRRSSLLCLTLFILNKVIEDLSKRLDSNWSDRVEQNSAYNYPLTPIRWLLYKSWQLILKWRQSHQVKVRDRLLSEWFKSRKGRLFRYVRISEI